MKKMLLMVSVLLFLQGCVNKHPLVGQWKTVNAENVESTLWFKADGSFEAITKGEKLPGRWRLDEEADPDQLELLFEEDKRVVTIVKLQTDQLLIEPRESDAPLPTEFSDQSHKYLRQ